MRARNHEHTTHREILTDHESELDDLCVAEMRAKLGLEIGINGSEILRHPLRITYSQSVSWLELSLRERLMDLRHDVFIQSLTRRRRVPGEESSIALVDRGNLKTREFFDTRRHDAFLMARSEKCEETLEEIWSQLHHIHGFVFGHCVLFGAHSRLLFAPRSWGS